MKKALVVEDREELIYLFKAYMKKVGLEVDSFTSGIKALDNFSAGKYDLIILDIGLGDMTGVDLCLKIREIDTEAYIIAITGHVDLFEEIDYKLVGFDEFYVKPLGYKDFMDAIEKFVKSKE